MHLDLFPSEEQVKDNYMQYDISYLIFLDLSYDFPRAFYALCVWHIHLLQSDYFILHLLISKFFLFLFLDILSSLSLKWQPHTQKKRLTLHLIAFIMDSAL